MKKEHILLTIIILLALVLRFYRLDSIPPSLHSDEVDIAYNAYSILKTARDEHGNFLPVSLRSFGDWKPALESYLMIPGLLIFGLNEWAVRLPSALLGTASVLVIYYLILTLNRYQNHKLALLVALFITISPWHLHQSRAILHTATGLFFLSLGTLLLLKSGTKRIYLILSILSIGLTFYAYHSFRIVSLLLVFFIAVKYRKDIVKADRYTILAIVSAILVILPLVIGFINEPNVLFGRVKTISIFYSQEVNLKIWRSQTEDGLSNIKPLISRSFHNKPYNYFLEIAKRYFQHLEPAYLLIKGDAAAPFKIPNMGVLYSIDGLFLAIGLYLAVRGHKKYLFIIYWLLIAIIPGALSYLTPAHNRTFNAVIPFITIISLGFIYLSRLFHKRLVVILTTLYCLNFVYYLYNYYKILPKDLARDWNYGMKEAVGYINENNFTKIIFLPQTGTAYPYILFYNKIAPQEFINNAKHEYSADEFGYEHTSEFDKYTFIRNKKPWDSYSANMEKDTLYIGRESEIPQEYSNKDIYYPDGKVALRMAVK